MAQTGVPFGDVARVRDWLEIEERVNEAARMHPKRPIQGFSCARSEVSGTRLWTWAEERFGTPKAFFRRFVWNYCPLAFLEASGKNRTSDRLPVAEREPLFAACDDALRGVVRAVESTHVIGIGAFAEARIRAAVNVDGLVVGRVLHPSPANRSWALGIEVG